MPRRDLYLRQLQESNQRLYTEEQNYCVKGYEFWLTREQPHTVFRVNLYYTVSLQRLHVPFDLIIGFCHC